MPNSNATPPLSARRQTARAPEGRPVPPEPESPLRRGMSGRLVVYPYPDPPPSPPRREEPALDPTVCYMLGFLSGAVVVGVVLGLALGVPL